MCVHVKMESHLCCNEVCCLKDLFLLVKCRTFARSNPHTETCIPSNECLLAASNFYCLKDIVALKFCDVTKAT